MNEYWRKFRGWLGNWERDRNGRRRPGTWMQCYTGEQAWPLDPDPSEIHYDDIVAGLRSPRYGGQTREPYLVIEHSVLVSCAAEKLARDRGHGDEIALLAARHGLMHDATEAYIGDVIRPLKKQRAMRGYLKVERLWERAVFERFGVRVHPVSAALVHECDSRIVLDEIEAVMIDPDMWSRTGRYRGMEPLDIEIPGWTADQGTIAFGQRFAELWTDWPEVTFCQQLQENYRESRTARAHPA